MDGIPAWTHLKWCRPSDPINIVFRDIPLNEIRSFLEHHGWKIPRFPLASNQFIPYTKPLSLNNKPQQDLQLSFGSVFRRFHMRLWEIKGFIIAGIHLDSLRFPGYHVSADFESVKREFVQFVRENNNPEWYIHDDAIDLDNRIAGYGQPFHNGRATLIEGRNR